MSVTINGSTGVTTPGISNSEGYTGDGLTIAAGAPSGAVAVDSSGNVGIGTSSPSQKLTVTGNAKIAGAQAGNVAKAIFTRTDMSWSVNNETDLRVYVGSGDTDSPSTKVVECGSTGDFRFNSGYGSVATAYGCRAWVNFNGTGTVAIRASGNVSSITDLGVGNYVVNFTTAMPDANFAVAGMTSETDGYNAVLLMNVRGGIARTTTSCGLVSYNQSSGWTDKSDITVAIFR